MANEERIRPLRPRGENDIFAQREVKVNSSQVGTVAVRDGIGCISEAACALVAEIADGPTDVLAAIRDLAQEGKLTVTRVGERLAIDAAAISLGK